ncbi:hypothetical protein CPB85DRAFT_1254432 [Mucidula mucida]|nr:hypothetical protein CPB85DRAFT_1254432 [Mucidula mucida]
MVFLERSGCKLKLLAFRRCQIDERLLVEMLTAQRTLITLRLDFCVGKTAQSEKPIPMPTLEFLSSDSMGGSDRPLPAFMFLTVLVHPQQLEAVKRLNKPRSAVSRPSEKKQRCWGADPGDDLNNDEIQKDQHAALFKDFVSNGIDISISYTGS